MEGLIERARALARGEAGQDLLEYALLTALIALAAVVAVRAAGVSINGAFTAISTAVAAALPA
jgi:pilus assembly protein Flp/PilA